ncbi:MAG: hypothetical protein ACK4ZM_04380, partial [bacterium]
MEKLAIFTPLFPLISFFLVALLVFLREKPQKPLKINKNVYSSITITGIFLSMLSSFILFF